MSILSIVLLLLALPASLRLGFYVVLGMLGLFIDEHTVTRYNKDVTQGGSSVPARKD